VIKGRINNKNIIMLEILNQEEEATEESEDESEEESEDE